MPKNELNKMFLPTSNTHPARTNTSLLQDYQAYKKEFLSMWLSGQTKKAHANVTQNYAHSVVNHLLADIPLECVTKATMHVILGITRTFVDWTFLLYNQLEKMETGTDFRTHASIEKALESTNIYHAWLEKQLEDTVAAVEGQVKVTDEFLKRMAAAEEILAMPGLSPVGRAIWEQKIQTIQEEQKQWEESNSYSENEVEFQGQLLEMLFIANQTSNKRRIKSNLKEARRALISCYHFCSKTIWS